MVSEPIEMPLAKNSTFWIVPSVSVALAVTLRGTPTVVVVRASGLVMLTVGAVLEVTVIERTVDTVVTVPERTTAWTS